MKQAAQTGATELEASKLAQTKAQRREVKSFAESMITDHTKVADEVKQLAVNKKVDPPSEPSMKQKAELKMISMGDDAKAFAEKTLPALHHPLEMARALTPAKAGNSVR